MSQRSHVSSKAFISRPRDNALALRTALRTWNSHLQQVLAKTPPQKKKKKHGSKAGLVGSCKYTLCTEAIVRKWVIQSPTSVAVKLELQRATEAFGALRLRMYALPTPSPSFSAFCCDYPRHATTATPNRDTTSTTTTLLICHALGVDMKFLSLTVALVQRWPR